MHAKIHILAVAEQAIPVKAIYNNVGDYGEVLKDVENTCEVEWSDGTVSTGIKHCCCVYYIEDENKKILVDTGVGDFERIRKIRDERGDRYYLKELESLEEKLAALNVTPGDIDIVINTHLHWDHIGGNTIFPNAKFIMPAADIPLALTAPKWAPHFFPGMRDCITKVADRTIAVDGDKKISNCVSVKWLGGHTPGSQAVLVKTKIGTVALAGDVVCKYENWNNNWIGPGGNIWNLGQLVKAYETLRMCSDVVVPGHDWRVFKVFPNGIIG